MKHRGWHWLRGRWRWVSRSPWSLALCGAWGVLAAALLAWRWGLPVPAIHDEFAYLLAGETYAGGRMTNPTPPAWEHLETYHVLLQPSYQAKFPPGQGLLLALGQLVTGLPIAGVWLSLGLFAAAATWMLRAYLPASWALLGGLAATAQFAFWGEPFPGGVAGYWSQTYWGGALSAAGGCLALGAWARLLKAPSLPQTLIFSLGVATLAITRPFEGLLLIGPLLVVLVWRARRDFRSYAFKVFVPGLAAGLLLMAGLGVYNHAVTGSATRLPYQEYETQYSHVPLFLWESPRTPPVLRHAIQQRAVAGWQHVYEEQRSWPGWRDQVQEKLARLGHFYLGLGLLPPLLAIPWALRRREFGLLLALGLAAVAFLVGTVTWCMPHYVAPFVGIMLLIWVQCVRQARLWIWSGYPLGRLLVPVYLLLQLVALPVARLTVTDGGPIALTWRLERARLVASLLAEGGRHLVLVEYGPQAIYHAEWVHNGADPAAAPIVWARAMNREADQALRAAYPQRKAWRVVIAIDRPVLIQRLD